MAKKSIQVQIAGKEYRVRSGASAAWLQRVAGYVDRSMERIQARTNAVDSLDVAVLTALNLARELVELREGGPGSSHGTLLEHERLMALTDIAESALDDTELPQAPS